MKISELFPFLYSWANQVLNTELLYNIPIIQSHENAPQPNGAYIAIAYTPANLQKAEHASNGDVRDDGYRLNVINYAGTIEIWEVNSDGRYLSELINSVEREEIKQLWATNKIAFWGSGPIATIPHLKDQDWKRESMVECRIAYADEVVDTAGFISETVITGEIPAEGRAGEHNINQTIGE